MDDDRTRDQLLAEINELRREVAKRDQIIGEVTVANRILKKLSGRSP